MTYRVELESGEVLEKGLNEAEAERELARACNEDLDAYIVDEDVSASPSEFLSEVYRLHRKNEILGDWDFSETESLYLQLLELEISNEFQGLLAAQSALLRSQKDCCDGFSSIIDAGLGIEPEAFPLYLLEQEPETFSSLQSQEGVDLLAKSLPSLTGQSQIAVRDRLIAIFSSHELMEK